MEPEDSRVGKGNKRNGEEGLLLGVVGLGRVGKACADAVLDAKDLTLAAIVRRVDRLAQPVPDAFSTVPVVSHTAQVPRLDGALLCVPTAKMFDAAHDCLQHGVPIVDASILHGEAFQAHREAIHRLAVRFREQRHRRHRLGKIAFAGQRQLCAVHPDRRGDQPR